MAANRHRYLLEAVDDLSTADAAPRVYAMELASPIYTTHHLEYVKELRAVKKIAEDWIERIIAVEAKRIGNRVEAEKNIVIRRPYGAVVYPMVIHCIRKAWLICQQLNDSVAVSKQVAPQAFVLLWLAQVEELELSAFIATLPYWPLGQDETGRWI